VKNAHKAFTKRLRVRRIAFHVFQASTRTTKAKQIANRVSQLLSQTLLNERQHVMHVLLVAQVPKVRQPAVTVLQVRLRTLRRKDVITVDWENIVVVQMMPRRV